MQFQVHKGRERLCLKMNRSSESNFLCTHSIRQHSNIYIPRFSHDQPLAEQKHIQNQLLGALSGHLKKYGLIFPHRYETRGLLHR